MVSEQEQRERSSGWRGGSSVGEFIYCNLYKTSHFRVPDRNPESGTRKTGDEPDRGWQLVAAGGARRARRRAGADGAEGQGVHEGVSVREVSGGKSSQSHACDHLASGHICPQMNEKIDI